MAGVALYQAGSNKISQFKKGDANVKAEIAGAAFGEILMMFGGEAAEAGKAGELAKLAELGGEAEKVAEAAKTGLQYTKSSLALGKEIHAGYRITEHAPALGRFKEFSGIKGIRPDFVDFGKKTIYELKPFNPRGIQLGTKQLNKYKSLFEQNYGGKWKTVLDHY